jgi:RNA polymerase sigma-70 factor (ECF subfamily)
MHSTPTHIIEQQMLEGLRAGNDHAFTKVYMHYYERVLFFARRYVLESDAQDIAADTFLQLWRKREGFTDLAAVGRFLFVTTRNRCYDFMRRRQVREQYAAELAELMANGTDDFFIEQVRIEFVKLIEAQVALLPEKMREIFLLSFRDGLKPAQIAGQLGITVKTVSNQKLSAIKLLRSALKDHPLEAVLLLLLQLDQVPGFLG